jgi:hypothetical protein
LSSLQIGFEQKTIQSLDYFGGHLSKNPLDIVHLVLHNLGTMKIQTQLKLMESTFGGEKEAAKAVGVSWDAWRRWKIGDRSVSLPVRRLMDRLLDEGNGKD